MCPSAQLAGLHSRSEALIEFTRSYDRGKAEWNKVEERLRLETEELVQLQEDLDFEYVSDGSLAWQDQLRPITQSVTGLTAGTRYSRWFDTNTFYQKPVVVGKLSLDGFRPEGFLQTDLLPETRKWKITLPGPYTFSELSENRFYDSGSDLLLDIARVEREIVKRLGEEGVSLFQLSEPCLVYQPYREDLLNNHEVDLALRAISLVVEDIPAKFLIQTCFGDAQPLLPRLLGLPVEGIGFDLYETDLSTVEGKAPKNLVLGIVDSRESQIEDPQWVADTATRITERLSASEVTFSPNSDLKFLPRNVADQKIRVLAKAATIFEEAR